MQFLRRLAIALALVVCAVAQTNVVDVVRAAISQNNMAAASQVVAQYRSARGVTPELLNAMSWIARGDLDAKKYDAAEKEAEQTYLLSREQLKKRPLDQEPLLPLALGAAIEVQANVFAARGERTQAVTYLGDQLKTYYATSIRARIQKNLNLLTLEGKPAPRLSGVVLPPGKPVLLFFWAHWCSDCKAEEPILARIKAEYAKSLAVVAPTQKYGYIAGGETATPEVELKYIEQVRRQFYADILSTPAPVSEENFRKYGASTTPTIVLVDRAGIVRLYHPGAMTYDELKAAVARVVKS